MSCEGSVRPTTLTVRLRWHRPGPLTCRLTLRDISELTVSERHRQTVLKLLLKSPGFSA